MGNKFHMVKLHMIFFGMASYDWMNEWMKVYFLLSHITFINEKSMCCVLHVNVHGYEMVMNCNV